VVEREGLCLILRVCWNWRCDRASGVIQNVNGVNAGSLSFDRRPGCINHKFCMALFLCFRCWRFADSGKEFVCITIWKKAEKD